MFVRATPQDLDTIEKAIQVLNMTPSQVHIKARFIEVEQDDSAQLGFDWYLGQFGHSVVAQGGTSASLSSTHSDSGFFPGQTLANVIGGTTTDQQLFSSGLGTSSTVGTITGILTNPNFRVVIHALETRTGFESLAEPEVTTLSGRQTQMRATDVQSIVTGYGFQSAGGTSTGTTTTP